MDAKILNEIDRTIEGFYSESIHIGEILASVFTNNRSQVKNLENLVYTTNRFTEVVNFIKNQMGKDIKRVDWAKKKNDLMIGEYILEGLDRIDAKAKKIVKNTDDLFFDVRMRLLRGWIRQVITHYEFILIRR